MRIGTRGSALAPAQTRLVAGSLEAHLRGPTAELVAITTGGDRGGAAGDKSRWVDELERALSAGEIDLAVHSAKDVPGELAEGLTLLGAPARAAPEDVLCGVGWPGAARPGGARGHKQHPPRRPAARRTHRPRGGRRQRQRRYPAAQAGERAASTRSCSPTPVSHDSAARPRSAPCSTPRASSPRPARATLALEGRADDERARQAVQAITDDPTFACLLAERAVAHALGADCNTPLGAHAIDNGCGCLHLRAWVGLPDGSAWVSDELLGGFYDPEALGLRMAERLLSAGAGELLRHAEELAVEHA